MSETILTKSGKADREVAVPTPNCLQVKTLPELIELVGEDVVLAKTQAQIVIDLRSLIRLRLEATDDNGDASNTDEEITAGYTDKAGAIIPWSEWTPSVRVTLSKEERLAKQMADMTPEQLRESLAKAGIDLSALQG